MGGGAVELQTEVRCSSEIAEHSLDKLKVRCPGRMHEQADLLHCISDVGSGEGEVLEGACYAAIEG
jgi:hypothetical protein